MNVQLLFIFYIIDIGVYRILSLLVLPTVEICLTDIFVGWWTLVMSHTKADPVTSHSVHPKELLINYPESQPFIWTKNRRREVTGSAGGVSQLKAWYYGQAK